MKQKNKRLLRLLFFDGWIPGAYVGAGLSFAIAVIKIVSDNGFFHWKSFVIAYVLIVFIFHKPILKKYPKDITEFNF